MDDVDVAIVGAGPVGLLTAIELTLGGARPVVLETLQNPSPTTKALGVGPLGAEVLRRRGMAAALADAEEQKLAGMAQADGSLRNRASKFSGHFAGLFIRKGAQEEPERRIVMVDQQGIEAVLADRAQALGIAVRRGCTVTGFDQDQQGVSVAYAGPKGDAILRCAFLVGCDGGRSAVRKMAGFAFPGTLPSLTMLQATVLVDQAERLMPAGWHRTPAGVFSYGAVPGRLFMIDFRGPPADRDRLVTPEEVEATLRHISGLDVRLTSFTGGSRWTDNTRLVETYRDRRVLLAGDAAHVHSPFGGQGLSLGLGDAANLGWKLARVLRHGEPDALLDTYTAERRPVAAAVLANTLAQTALMRPDPQSGALRDIVAALLETDAVACRMGAMMRGLSTRYDLGAEAAIVGRVIGDGPVGDRTLFDLMQDGRGLLLDGSDDGWAARLADAVPSRVLAVRIAEGPSLLIRPDACVAWTSDTRDEDGLRTALHRWFGHPRRPGGAAAAA